MVDAMSLPVASTWNPGQNQWRDYYICRLQSKLVWATEHVRTQRPRNLAAHYESLLTILEQARLYPHLHHQMVDMMVALSDWPVQWGHWHAWERVLRFGSNVASRKQEPARYAALLKQLSHLTLQTGRLEEAVELGRRTFEQAAVARAPDLLAEAATIVISVLMRQGNKDAAHDFLGLAERQLARCPKVGTAPVHLYWSHALVARRQGYLDEAEDWANRAVVWLEQQDPRHPLLGEALDTRGVYRWARADYAAAEGDIHRAIAFLTRQGDEYAAMNAQGSLSLVYLDTGKLAQAETVIRRIIAYEEQHKAHWYLAMNIGSLAWLYLLMGKFDQALAYNDQHLNAATQNRDMQEIARARGIRGKVLLHTNPESALPHLKAWQLFHRERGSPEGLADSYGTIARCLAALHRPDEALLQAQDALALARKIGQPAVQFALRCLGEQLPLDQREAPLQEALTMAWQLGRRLDEAACLLWLAGLKTGREQTRLWKQGAHLLERCSASAWLTKYALHHPPPIP